MAERAIVNASPLIFFSRSYHLDLLQHIADEIWVPEPVATEILQRGQHDITAKAMQTTEWLSVKPCPRIPLTIVEWRLGAGESGVLALANEYSGTNAIIDDLSARKCAASLNIPVRGTLGVVLTAKQRGIIPNARNIIEDMMANGLYLSTPVLNHALKRVGE